MDQAPPPAIVCHVKAERGHERLALHGELVSRSPATGTYRLEITKSGPSGRSTISQAGAFVARPDEPVSVGSAAIDFAPGTTVASRLTLLADGRTYQCENLEDSL